VTVHLVHRIAKSFELARDTQGSSHALGHQGSPDYVKSHVLEPFERSLRGYLHSSSEVTSKNLTHIVWSFARFGYQPSEIVDSLNHQILKNINKFTPQGLANTTWGLSRLGILKDEVIRATSTLIQKSDRDYSHADISSLAKTLVLSGKHTPEVLASLVNMSKGKIASFDTRSLSNLFDALAKADFKSESLLYNGTAEFKRKMYYAKPEDLALTSAAMGKLRFRDDDLFEQIGDKAIRQLDKFNPKNTANLLYGYASLNIADSFLFEGAVEPIVDSPHPVPATSIANIAWSCAISAPHLVEHLVSPDDLDLFQNDDEWMQVYTSLLRVGAIEPDRKFDRYDTIEKNARPKKVELFEKAIHSELSRHFQGSSVSIIPQKFVAGSHVDFVVRGRSLNLIVECDGRCHKSIGPNGNYLIGKDVLQDELFKICGYNVIHIKAEDYYGRNSKQALKNMFNEM
jgi:very-short-patch-repair endonuclease